MSIADAKEFYIVQNFHDNSNLKSRTGYINGIREGLHEEWYENQKLKIRTSYEKNVLNGCYEHWFQNGQLYVRTYFKNGMVNDVYEEWYQDGSLFSRGNFVENLRQGMFERWYPNGNKLSIECFVNDKLHGGCTRWFNSEIITGDTLEHSREIYINGIRQHIELLYKNGQKCLKVSYDKGKIKYPVKLWTRDGVKHLVNSEDDIPKEFILSL